MPKDTIEDMAVLLSELWEYFDNRSDILDGPEGSVHANKEMHLLGNDNRIIDFLGINND